MGVKLEFAGIQIEKLIYLQHLLLLDYKMEANHMREAQLQLFFLNIYIKVYDAHKFVITFETMILITLLHVKTFLSRIFPRH